MEGENKESDDAPLQKLINKGVCLANRLDLHRLASFIEINLPHRSDVYAIIYQFSCSEFQSETDSIYLLSFII